MFLPMLDLNLNLQGRTFLRVNGASGSDNPRRGKNRAYQTLQAAVDDADAGGAILVAPGLYDETVTIPRTKSQIVIVGMGGRGAAYIDPSTEDAGGMVVHGDDISLVNMGVAAEDATSATALTVTGARFRASGCKIENGAKGLVIGPGTVAQEAAGTHGTGADALFEDCEFAWSTTGVVFTATDYGAVTQVVFDRCRFHNLSAAAFEEAGGTVSIRYRDVLIRDCVFGDAEDGTAPTKYISLNDDNANAGIVCDCVFPTAINSGLNLVSTALHWIGNRHTGGIATAQPS
jgi:pectin methylesterase-like acyl-CoA thioesterase